MKQFTIQILETRGWQDAAVLTVVSPEKGRASPCRLDYIQDYALEHLHDNGVFAVSLNHPVKLFWQYVESSWFSFLDDLVPSGAARRYWIQALGLAEKSREVQDFSLLERGVMAPVGNLRFKEAVPCSTEVSWPVFTVADVVKRQVDFLEYAAQMGAVSGGATGAAGEAPKLLLRCSAQNEVFIDSLQDQETNPATYYLVKFPRGRCTSLDCDVLRAEYHFYQELHQMGVTTIATSEMRLEEGHRFPSLWLPRFDVYWNQDRWVRLGLESVLSTLKQPSGVHLNHLEVLQQLLSKLQLQPKSEEAETLVCDWVCRDLLNIAFGNSDNHGRNSAILKDLHGMRLAPVFDFAPMRADPQEVIRTITWKSPLELGGEYDWPAIAKHLCGLCEPEKVMQKLQATAQKLQGLGERLKARGVPQKILEMPAMGFGSLDRKLKRWDLL